MSAVPVAVVESPAYFEVASQSLSSEETIHNLVHELRQPLSSIEAIAYYLEMTLPAEQFHARQYMRRLQQLVDQADSALKHAASDVRKPCGIAKRAGTT